MTLKDFLEGCKRPIAILTFDKNGEVVSDEYKTDDFKNIAELNREVMCFNEEYDLTEVWVR